MKKPILILLIASALVSCTKDADEVKIVEEPQKHYFYLEEQKTTGENIRTEIIVVN